MFQTVFYIKLYNELKLVNFYPKYIFKTGTKTYTKFQFNWISAKFFSPMYSPNRYAVLQYRFFLVSVCVGGGRYLQCCWCHSVLVEAGTCSVVGVTLCWWRPVPAVLLVSLCVGGGRYLQCCWCHSVLVEAGTCSFVGVTLYWCSAFYTVLHNSSNLWTSLNLAWFTVKKCP